MAKFISLVLLIVEVRDVLKPNLGQSGVREEVREVLGKRSEQSILV